jgi:deazaflavin-dependent oxidoreductase (nitroreductase family)
VAADREPVGGVKTKPKGLDRPSTVKVIKVMSAANTWLYRTTGGRVGRTWRIGSAVRKGVPICLLTTTGRTSGQARTVPLCYLADDDRIVLVASQGGLPNDPQWYKNLVADPKVEIQIGTRSRRMSARTAAESEREVLWPRLLELYADYASYQEWTDRTIPVVICEPIGEVA